MNRPFANLRAALAPLFLVLALLGAGTRALTPDGYMPSVDGGWLSVRICSGIEPVFLEINLETGETRAPNAPDHDREGAPCAFSAGTTPVLSAETGGLPLPAVSGSASPAIPQPDAPDTLRLRPAGNRDPPRLI